MVETPSGTPIPTTMGQTISALSDSRDLPASRLAQDFDC